MTETDIRYLKGGDRFDDRLDRAIIYSLINLDNGKRYIGRTRNPKKRIEKHFIGLKAHKHENKLLNEDSGCSFAFEILEENVPYIEETERERYWMLHFRTNDSRYGYNANDPMFCNCKRKRKERVSI